MKRRMAALLLAVLLTAPILGACGSGAPASSGGAVSGVEAGDLLAQIQDKGEITVAMEGTWAPWTYHDEDDNLVGYDVEVARAIAGKLGVEVNFCEGEWNGRLAGVDGGRYDVMVNGVNVDEERQE